LRHNASVDENLTLDGLQLIWQRTHPKS